MASADSRHSVIMDASEGSVALPFRRFWVLFKPDGLQASEPDETDGQVRHLEEDDSHLFSIPTQNRADAKATYRNKAT